MGRGDLQRPQDLGRVVGHQLRRDRSVRHGGAARAAVVEGGEAVAVGQPIQLELPGLDGVAQAADKQDVGSLADLLGPDVEVAGRDVGAHHVRQIGRDIDPLTRS
jgi:hypothetical protein